MASPEAQHHLYVIRHGRTRLNTLDALRGRIDEPLDEAGRTEAAALGNLFRAIELELVVTSPLSRARVTAEAIADSTGAELVVELGLADRDYGPWNGESRAEVVERFGSLELAPGVEPRVQLERRVTEAALAVLRVVRRAPAALVAHDAVNRVLLARMVPEIVRDGDSLPQPTGCWNELVCLDGSWSAATIGALPGDGRVPARVVA